MKTWIVIYSVLVIVFSPFQTMAQEKIEEEVAELKEVVVTATRVPILEKEVGSSVTVITEEEIEAKGYSTVKEVLKGSLGLDVVSTGGPGAETSVFLRGANSYHTLVLIDGMGVGDPSLPQRQFNFANLTVDNIERVEIVRGPQSVLYGADAMGGVINIITKRGEKRPYLYMGAEAGSYSTWRGLAGTGFASEKADFSLAYSHTRTDGFSAADEDLPGNVEDDSWENTTVCTRAGVTPSDWIDMGVSFRFQKGRTDLDMGGGPYRDVEDYHLNRREVFGRPYINAVAFDGIWEQIFAYGFVDHRGEYINDPWGDSSYEGEKHEISWQHNLYIKEANTLTAGIEYEKEGMQSETPVGRMDESAYTHSLFAQDQIRLSDASFTTAGARWDRHKEFGSHVTFRVTQAFVTDKTGTKVKGSFGTGFRAPSLYELNAPAFWGMPVGNPALDPEKSKGWDAGVEQSLLDDRLTVGVTYFANGFDDLINYVYGLGYVNIEEAETRGVEAFIEAIPVKGLSTQLSYTYTETEDDQGERLIRRPLNKVGLNVCYRFLDGRGTANLDIPYVGERDDMDFSAFPARRVSLDDYAVVNLRGSFKVHRDLEVFGRIENLFDEDYEQAFGYGTPGFSAYGGMKLTF